MAIKWLCRLSSFPSLCFISLDGEVTVKKCRSASNNAGPEVKIQVRGGENAGLRRWLCRSAEVIMQVPGDDILWPELMSEWKWTLYEKMKANGTMFRYNSIMSEIFISEWTLSLTWLLSKPIEIVFVLLLPLC